MVQAGVSSPIDGNHRLSMCREGRVPSDDTARYASLGRRRMDLLEAVDACDERRCDRLLRCHNVEPNVRDEKGRTPLEMAAAKGNRRICEMLLVYGAKSRDYRPGTATPLHSAAERGSVEIADLLLQRDFDVDHQSEEGDTALHIACHHGHSPLVSFLIQFANKNIRNRRSLTPLDEAREQGHEDVIRLLSKLRVHPPLARAKAVDQASLKDHKITPKHDVLLRVRKDDLSRCKSEPIREQYNIPPTVMVENARSHENLTAGWQAKGRTVYAHECCPCAEKLRKENGQLRDMCDDLQIKLTLALDEIERLKRRSDT